MDKRKIIIITIFIAIYFVSSILSYSFFSQKPKIAKVTSPVDTSTTTAKGTVSFDDKLPKTEECPLNGAFYSKKQKDWWEKHRPLGVMIENHEDSRPQSGLSSADVVYEAVAEGGISRFLAVFYCQDASPIGPVRSARTYFLDFVSEYGLYPLYAHVGGANRDGPADALSQIETYKWGNYNDMNQFSIGFPTFWRDYNRLGQAVATEHTMYSSTTKLWDFAKKSRDLTEVDKDGDSWDDSFVGYSFKNDAGKADRGTTQAIHIELWKGYGKYFIDWQYDPVSNVYKRKNGGEPHVDKNTGEQLAAKSLVVVTMAETALGDEEGHLLYKTKGTGKAAIFMDGKRITGTWRKDSRTARLLIFNDQGAPVKFNRGSLWFQVLPQNGVMTVQ
jgi:hypothetical protein